MEPVRQWYKSGELEAIADVFGFDANQMCRCTADFPLPVQEIGGVALPQGRLIAFPNTMEHRREPFRLEDPTKPGHHRWVTLMLVDPNYRICSTRNVPPQKADSKRNDEDGEGQEGCFSTEEADQYRKQMDKERVWANYARYLVMGPSFFDCGA